MYDMGVICLRACRETSNLVNDALEKGTAVQSEYKQGKEQEIG